MKPLPFLIVMLLAAGRALDAQQPPAAAPAVAPVPALPDGGPTPPPNYAYEPESRRDPFMSLLNSGTDRLKTPAKGARPDGLAGILVDEVAVRGVVQSRGTWVAMIAAPNGRSYTLRAGDRLMDGTVRAVTAEAVVLMQQVNNPLSLEKQREVRKQLRGEVK